jgi:hypothetical protein
VSDNVESITKQIDKDAADLLRLLARQVDTDLGELHRRVDELSRLRVAYMRAADRLDPLPPDDLANPLLDPGAVRIAQSESRWRPRHMADESAWREGS